MQTLDRGRGWLKYLSLCHQCWANDELAAVSAVQWEVMVALTWRWWSNGWSSSYFLISPIQENGSCGICSSERKQIRMISLLFFKYLRQVKKDSLWERLYELYQHYGNIFRQINPYVQGQVLWCSGWSYQLGGRHSILEYLGSSLISASDLAWWYCVPLETAVMAKVLGSLTSTWATSM